MMSICPLSCLFSWCGRVWEGTGGRAYRETGVTGYAPWRTCFRVLDACGFVECAKNSQPIEQRHHHVVVCTTGKTFLYARTEKMNVLMKLKYLIQWSALVACKIGHGPKDVLAIIITRTRQAHHLAQRTQMTVSGIKAVSDSDNGYGTGCGFQIRLCLHA